MSLALERKRKVLVGFVENLEFPNIFERIAISKKENPKGGYSDNPLNNLSISFDKIIKNDFIDDLSKVRVIAQIKRSGEDLLAIVASILDEFIGEGWLTSRNHYSAADTLNKFLEPNTQDINNLQSYIDIRKGERQYHGLSYFNQTFQSKEIKLEAADKLLDFLKNENDPINCNSEDHKQQIINALSQGRLGKLVSGVDQGQLLEKFKAKLEEVSPNQIETLP